MHVKPTIATLLNGLNNPSLPGVDLSLERMWQLLAALDNPQEKLPPVIHAAGTNGKGSTLAFLRAMYQAAGYRVHAYTSPHLVRFNERILLGGSEISDVYLEQLLVRVSDAAREIPVTFFEATTALALLAFAEHAADVLLLETGLGGRLDATNVVSKPLATLITPVDYDHKEFLGETLTDIAMEKAGIIKHGVPCFMGAQKPEAREVLKRVGRERKAAVKLHGRDWSYEAVDGGVSVLCGTESWLLPVPALAGEHQLHNAALASVVARSLPQLPVNEAAMNVGIAKANWPARLQLLTQGPLVEAWGVRGEVRLDGGHNVHAAEALARWIEMQDVSVVLLCGMMQRKDAVAFFAPLAKWVAGVIAVPIPNEPGSYAPEALAEAARAAGILAVQHAENLTQAVALASSEAAGTLLIAGSLFLAGVVLENHS